MSYFCLKLHNFRKVIIQCTLQATCFLRTNSRRKTYNKAAEEYCVIKNFSPLFFWNFINVSCGWHSHRNDFLHHGKNLLPLILNTTNQKVCSIFKKRLAFKVIGSCNLKLRLLIKQKLRKINLFGFEKLSARTRFKLLFLAQVSERRDEGASRQWTSLYTSVQQCSTANFSARQ